MAIPTPVNGQITDSVTQAAARLSDDSQVLGTVSQLLVSISHALGEADRHGQAIRAGHSHQGHSAAYEIIEKAFEMAKEEIHGIRAKLEEKAPLSRS
ncbi:hypothetical protein PVT67_17845 [Gallaecimonas kandeliae]|uniref:hypothetical protein n=1 Tax=Gallaecimonas kandeliae TaxID=3029055 RepID=UPI002648E2E0|nr:hypothetical protein [Gallaecimonas kandeliae]WKE65506.1 hypothetical protein PVT67_17845 [Gallaecimonas kandeliae]